MLAARAIVQTHLTTLKEGNLVTTPVNPSRSTWHVGDRVDVRDQEQYKAGWISSIHRANGCVEYVVHTDPVDGIGVGGIINVDAATGRLRSRRNAD